MHVGDAHAVVCLDLHVVMCCGHSVRRVYVCEHECLSCIMACIDFTLTMLQTARVTL